MSVQGGEIQATTVIMIGARSLVAERKVLLVPDGLNGERVDAAVARMLGIPRSRVVELIGTGHILLDGSEINKSDRVSVGSMLEIELPDHPRIVEVRPQQTEGVVIVHDDDDIVVIDKPVGVAAHPSLGWSGPDVLSHLAGAGFRISTSGVPERRGIVQRLDVGTSGLMVVAKSDHALVQGHPDPFTGTIEAAIGRDPRADYKMAVMRGGRHSVTHYTTLEAFLAVTLLEIKLETGRTHQIRVHMAAIRHPCVGDRMYGADPALAAKLGLERQWLHAVRLGFVHPTSGEEMQFESPYPADLQHALDAVHPW
jgi:23S rRNA pseudouridine1911/1915/1917 synthase